jgi:uncharacterized cupin superfamily protein
MGEPSEHSFVVPAAALRMEAYDFDEGQVVSGEPRVSSLELAEADGLAVGLWEHTAGVSTDTEEDEVFVVLAGRATIALGDGSTLDDGPGDVGVLRAGESTTWRIHGDLRKIYVTGIRPRREELEET